MRILIVTPELPPDATGGIGAVAVSIAPALASRGHDVHILYCAPHLETSDSIDAGVHVHRRPWVRRVGMGRVLRLPYVASRVYAAISAWRAYRQLPFEFDLIETSDWMAQGLLFGLRRTRPLVVRLATPDSVIAEHNERSPGLDRRLADRMERSAVNRATVVMCPSQMLVNDLGRAGWLDPSKTWVVPSAVDLDRWADLPPPGSNPPRALAVGRIEPRKGPHLLIEACGALSRELTDLETVFVGDAGGGSEDSSYLAELKVKAEQLDTAVTFVGQVPRDELPAWYGSARVVVLASTYDNFPMAGLEALASGRPLVCTRQTGLAPFIEAARAGAVVDNPSELSGALRPFLVDPDLANETGRRARELAENEFSPEQVVELREAVYEFAIRSFA